MDERWFNFDELSPEQALRMLAALPTAQAEDLPIKGIRVKLERGAFGCHVSLLFSDPHMEEGRASKIKVKAQFLSSMIDCYREIKGREPVSGFEAQSGSELEKGLIGLVLNSVESNEDPTPMVEDEAMVVSRDATSRTAAEQLHHIQLHSSYAYIAEADSAQPVERYYLFDIKKDKERKSTFESIIGTGILKYAELLNSFEVGQYHLFLPGKHAIKSGDSSKDMPIRPGLAALNDFCKILLLLKGRSGEALPATSRVRLAAVCPVDSVEKQDSEGGAIYSLLLLSNMRWRSQYDPHLRPVRVEEYQVHQLVDSEIAQQNLRPAIADINSNAGYRLELRQMDHDGGGDQEREKVKEKLAELEHRLEYLNGAKIPCPELYRFTAAQLPALAYTLRTFHIKSLELGAISYGFQSNRDHPEGLHYLFVDTSRSVEIEASPIPILEGIAGSPIRYQVDPLWAQHYLQHSSETLIYVPEGCTLYPSMHDWDLEGSDDYLRAIMSRWFHGQNGIPDIPEKPIYIFDGEPRPGCPISITVLNKGSFVPVKQKLGWINDNLQIYESFPVEDVITGLASSAGRKQMFQAMETDSDMVIAKSSEVIKKASNDVVAHMESLVEGYNQEIPDLIEFIKKTNKKIRKQKGRVNLLSKQKLDIERFLHETEQGIDAVGKVDGEVKAEIAQLRARTGMSISDATVALRELEENVGKKITQLESEKHALLEQLKRAHRIFS
jgi:hypothetical protein